MKVLCVFCFKGSFIHFYNQQLQVFSLMGQENTWPRLLYMVTSLSSCHTDKIHLYITFYALNTACVCFLSSAQEICNNSAKVNK